MSNYDIVVYGATGFTGRLVSEYLTERAPALGIRWAMAGRSREKLEQVRVEIGAEDVPLVIADAALPSTIETMVRSTRLVLTTVGPYQHYGSVLVAACAAAGVDYIDLCGEPHWMRQMIDEHSAGAAASGARILFSCGFDSIPSEIGVWLLQREAIETFGAPLPRVRGRLVTFLGGPGGGSMATGAATAGAAGGDPAVRRLLDDPFALAPGFHGPEQPTGRDSGVEPDVGPVRPFFLAATDVQNVHRSNLLLSHRYGTDFVYDEMLVGENPFTPPPGAPLQPGEGPSVDEMNAGAFEILFIGSSPDGRAFRFSVSSSKDPGFLTTSRMVVETSLSLLAQPDVRPGVWTPVAALGEDLVDRLANHAFMAFAVVGPAAGADSNLK